MKKIGCYLLVCVLTLLGIINVNAADKCLLKVNTDGLGQIEVVSEGETIEFSDDYPMQSAVENTEKGTKFIVGAKADKEWKFAKWTLNGEDYATDEIITVEVNNDMDLVAVFEFENEDIEETLNPESFIDEENENKKMNLLVYVGIAGGVLVLVIAIVVLLKKRK